MLTNSRKISPMHTDSRSSSPCGEGGGGEQGSVTDMAAAAALPTKLCGPSLVCAGIVPLLRVFFFRTLRQENFQNRKKKLQNVSELLTYGQRGNQTVCMQKVQIREVQMCEA